MAQELDEIQTEFLAEVGGLLDECQESFLNLENSAHPEEELAAIFRLAHSIKGTGAAVGFSDFAAFAHKLEDLLSILRTYPDRLDSEAVSILLTGSDLLKRKVQLLSGQIQGEWGKDECEARALQKIQQLGGAANSVVAPSPFAESQPTVKDEPAQAVENARAAAPGSAPAAAPTQAKAVENTVKVSTDKIDEILSSVSELVVLKSQLSQEFHGLSRESTGRLGLLLDQLDVAVRDIHAKSL